MNISKIHISICEETNTEYKKSKKDTEKSKSPKKEKYPPGGCLFFSKHPAQSPSPRIPRHDAFKASDLEGQWHLTPEAFMR